MQKLAAGADRRRDLRGYTDRACKTLLLRQLDTLKRHRYR